MVHMAVYGKVNGDTLETLLLDIAMKSKQSKQSENALIKHCKELGAKDIRIKYHEVLEVPDFTKALNI